MFKLIVQWNETLLHKVLGIPHRDHREAGTSVSAVLRSHPPVPAHHRQHAPAHHHHAASGHSPRFQAQLARELGREPRVLKGWQRRIAATFERRSAD